MSITYAIRDADPARPTSAPQAIVIDLTQPNATPFKAAYDLIQTALHESFKDLLPLLFDPVVYLDFSDLTNIWYGLESIGNTNLIKAKRLAMRLAERLQGVELYLLVLVDSSMTEENLAFLWYFYQKTRCALRFCYQAPAFYDTYAPVFSRLSDAAAASEDLFDDPAHQWHSALRLPETWLQLFDSPFYEFLIDNQRLEPASDDLERRMIFIWHILSTGATDLALAWLTICCRLEQDAALRARLFVARQAFLLGLQHFTRLQQPDMEVAPATQDEATTLAFIQGYAALLTNDQARAADQLAAAGIHAELEAHQTHELYQLNAFSLLAFRGGETKTAQSLQQRISGYREQPALYTTNIHYTNELNLGRIARSKKEYAAALTHFERAFQQLEGFKQPADYLYQHLLLAEVLEALGDVERAFFHWVTAALVWSALVCKNAVHWRIQAFLLKTAFRISQTVPSSVIGERLRQKLTFFADMGCYKPISFERAVPIRTLETDRAMHTATYIYAPFLSMIGTSDGPEIVDPFEQTPIYRSVNQQLLSIVAAKTGYAAIEGFGCLYLDFDHGMPTPSAPAHIALRCSKLGASLWCQGATTTPVSDPADIRAILHPSIRSVSQSQGRWYAHYRRYRAPEQLTFFEYVFLSYLKQQQATFPQIQQAFSGLELELLFAMQDKHLVHLVTSDVHTGQRDDTTI
ncbi:MAG TPA: hypothetical protein VFZ66_26865 [Herpetosiphonaceae bacterium]